MTCGASSFPVIPAKAGIQQGLESEALDPSLRGETQALQN